MEKNPAIRGMVNKTVPFHYLHQDLEFMLSHALFSSYGIDVGTKAILRAIRPTLAAADGPHPATALDVGCGTGIIGIALAKACPGLSVTALDRDALALSFTLANAEANGLGDRIKVRGGLLLDLEPGERFDLIVTNIPAKAGTPALEDFFFRSPSFLSPGGVVWVVIVNSLANQALSSLLRAGHEILSEEEGKEHTVLSFRAGPAPRENPLPGRLDPDIDMSIRAVHSLPDFDMPSWGL